VANMARDLVRDPDELDDEEQPRPRRYIIPGPNRPASRDAGLPSAPDLVSQPPPPVSAQPTIPPPPTTLAERLQAREATLMGKLNPPRAETRLGRIGQVLGTIGQDVGAAIAPGVMEAIPGTTLQRRAELGTVRRALGEEQSREALAGTEAARTGIEQEKLGIERQKAGLPKLVPGQEYTAPSGKRYNLFEWPGGATGYAEEGTTPQGPQPLPPAGIPSGTLGQPAPAAPPPPGTLPTTQPPAGAAAAAPAPLYGVALPPGGTYGKQPEGQIPLRPDELKQVNDEAASFWGRLNKGAPVPPQYQLKTGATKEDAARLQEMLKAEQSAAGTAAQREFTQEQTRERAGREAETARTHKEEAAAKIVRAVDNDDKVHLLSRGDYDANQRNFHPNPMTANDADIKDATNHNTVLNEMQARMNATAESAQNFNWKDRGQRSVMIQAMQNVEHGWADKLLGIPAVDFVAQHLRELGLEGATPETREYVVDLLALREAMLGMPKEITGGSRMMEKSIEALYLTLPSAITPDRKWAMTQLQASQSILDRLRGSRVPIIDGMRQVPKVPNLYKFSAVNPQTKQEIFSDDKKNWVDEDGRPVRQ
jgi:hypothetical protein